MKSSQVLHNLFHFYVVPGILATIGGLVPAFSELPLWVCIPVMYAVLILYYVLMRKKLDRTVVVTNAWVLGILAVTFSVLLILGKGAMATSRMTVFTIPAFPYFLFILLFALMGPIGEACLLVVGAAAVSTAAAWVLTGSRFSRRQVAGLLVGLVLLAGVDTAFYVNRPEARYGGHGFAYMHGYSSTDFTDYTVYAKSSRLAVLDAPASLQISDHYPVLDGAEACYPLYSALAKAVYTDIESIEAAAKEERFNGRYVTFTNSAVGFDRLYRGEADLFFGARPSQLQLKQAQSFGQLPQVLPIGKEAFVFFVEAGSPVSDLTSQQLRDIYSGKITNWAQLGGKDEQILAFQRPAYSGSQTMMEWFMGDTPLQEPRTYETYNSMDGVIASVAQYHNEAGAIGYSFRYFVEELSQEGGVKLLTVDGVAPTLENIKNGTYPLTVDLCLMSMPDNPNPHVQEVIDFMLSPQGQELVEKSGYAPLN